MKLADVLILSCLSLTPRMNANMKMNECCHIIEKAVRSGGNVLIPCFTSGQIYDIFEVICNFLESKSLGSIPIYFISPVAEHSLAYSNIMAEWLSDDKQKSVYIPEEPFLHAQYVRSGRIKHFTCISEESFNNEFRHPCIVFTGHPSLRYGDVVHFVELWKNCAQNMILFTGKFNIWSLL